MGKTKKDDKIPNWARSKAFLAALRDKWTRIEARETHATNDVQFRPGDLVVWSRSVIRAGYWLQRDDMPDAEFAQEVVRRVALRSGLDNLTVALMFQALDGNAYYNKPGLAEQALAHIGACQAVHCVPVSLKREIRGAWLQEARKAAEQAGKPVGLRTLWYLDHPPILGTIGEDEFRQIGHYYKAQDYEWPSSLESTCHQRLYWVRALPGSYRMDKVLNCRLIRVHPLDLALATPLEIASITDEMLKDWPKPEKQAPVLGDVLDGWGLKADGTFGTLFLADISKLWQGLGAPPQVIQPTTTKLEISPEDVAWDDWPPAPDSEPT